MKLSEIYNEIQTISGRLDLEDSAIIGYINKGIRLLDTLQKNQKKQTRYILSIDEGFNTLVLPAECRSISGVYISTLDTTERVLLAQVSLAELRELYNNSTNLDSCSPIVYSPISVEHYQPDTLTMDQLGFFVKYGDFVLNNPYAFTGIVLYPKITKFTAVEIFGDFYSPKLTSTIVQNWWTVNHPELVVKAALFKLNSDYYNSAGQKATLDEIVLSMQEIIYDYIEESTNHLTVLEG